jgi:molybdopterin converting factor subunit 1
MEIRLRYFASLREITGHSEETLTVAEGTRVADVRDLLQARYPGLQPVIERCISAVNRSYVSAETALHEHDEVVFIPPMGGGGIAPNSELFHLPSNPIRMKGFTPTHPAATKTPRYYFFR